MTTLAERTTPGPAATLALGLAVAAPLVWLPGGFDAFVLPKLLLTALSAVAAALAVPAGRLPRAVVVTGAVWAVCFAVSGLLGDSPWSSVLGRWPRFEGLPVLGLYAAACWTGARVVAPDAGGAARLRRAVGSTGLVLAVFSLLDLVGVSPLAETAADRSGSLLGNATDQGAVAMLVALVVAGPVLGLGRGRDRDRVGPWRFEAVALVGALATVAASGSRAALALTAVGLLVTAVWVSGRRVWPAVAAVVGLVALALLVPGTRDRLLDGATGSARLEQWRLTAHLVADHPWLGLGGSRYLDAFGAYESASFVRFTGAGRPADSPHSILLQVLVAGGVLLAAVTLVGLALLVRRVATVVRQRPETRPAAVAVAASLVLLAANFSAAGPTCLVALILGTLLATPTHPAAPAEVGASPTETGASPTERGENAIERGGRAGERGQVGAALVGVACGAAALGLVAACVAEIRLDQGVDAAISRDVPAAVARLEAARTWRPWDVDVGIIGGRALAEQAALGGDDAETAARAGADLLGPSLDRTSDDAQGLVALGVVRLSLGDLDGALNVLDDAVAAAPNRPDAYVQRAIARYGLDDRPGARADLARAAEISPRSPVVQRLQRQIG